MGVLTADMRRVLDEQQLGFVATVCPDGTPNLSPKGTTAAWDDDHIVFADICSPRTVANLRQNPAVEINVVDVLARKGYRFKGLARILSEGPEFDAALDSGKFAAVVDRDLVEGNRVGVQGTPAVYVNGRPLGDDSPAGLRAAVEAALKSGA